LPSIYDQWFRALEEKKGGDGLRRSLEFVALAESEMFGGGTAAARRFICQEEGGEWEGMEGRPKTCWSSVVWGTFAV